MVARKPKGLTPERAMERALVVARGGDGRTFPNPSVGAVLYRGNRILAAAHSSPAGGAHAEILAMRRAMKRHGERSLRGASLAVTLEPCSHQGRTGPCADALIAAGIARVFVGQRDPNPHVSGRGIRRLRRAGVGVEVGLLAEACADQHRAFFSAMKRGRPWVSLKLAATLDGRIATAGGESRWITSPESRARVHRLRDRHDAIAVGSGTVRADDPALSIRRRDGRVLRWPVRVIVDGGLTVSPQAAVFRDQAAGTTLCLTRRGHSGRRRALRESGGARVIEVPARGEYVDLTRGFERLAAEGLTSVWVEGGGGLAAALLARGLVDELHWFAAPTLLGADARAAIGALGLARLADRVKLDVREVRRSGPDLYVHARVGNSKEQKGRRR
jgi:diaminohydroxyphosphoribosylaminopyrimidine deaminase/5-amino-6-(5-phosphoribosylamino)uracil reductase